MCVLRKRHRKKQKGAVLIQRYMKAYKCRNEAIIERREKKELQALISLKNILNRATDIDMERY